MLNRYIIERKIPGVGASSKQDYTNMAETSNKALSSLGPKIQWVQSYVTDDKVYCEYFAENEDVVREHAKLAGFPADKISKVVHVCDPTTANEDVDVLKAPQTSKQENTLHS